MPRRPHVEQRQGLGAPFAEIDVSSPARRARARVRLRGKGDGARFHHVIVGRPWSHHGQAPRFRSSPNSPLEGSGFELPVPRAMQERPKAMIAGFGCKPPLLDYLRLLSADITEGGPKRSLGTEASTRAEPEVRIHFPPVKSLRTFGSARSVCLGCGRCLTLGVNGRSSNTIPQWAQHCEPPRVSRRRKRAMLTRARELWEQLGSPSEFLQIPFGQSRYLSARGELDLSMRLDQDLLRLSRERNDTAGLLLGHLSSGRNLMHAGKFALSRSHLQEVLALYDPGSHSSLVHQIGFLPHVNAQVFLGIVLFCLGFPHQALAVSNAAIAEARTLAHPPTLAGSLAVCVRLLSLIGDEEALDERTKQLVAVATEQGFALWRALGTIFRGWVEVRSGNVTQGVPLLSSGLAAYRVTGAELAMAYYTALQAGACEIAGQMEEASTLLEEASEAVEATGERWLEAELYRRKAKLLQRLGHFDTAEELYQKALSIAREQGAKLWELRAAVSLAQLRRDQGRRAEARDLLAPVYGWFTEGFDTPDLKDAKARCSRD